MSIYDFNVSNVAIYKIQSAGAAYNLTLPFEPDCVEWWNYTKYGTAATDATRSASGVWFSGMPDAYALNVLTIVDNGTTALKNTVLQATEGLTELSDGSGFAAEQKLPTVVSAGAACTVTITGHGWSNGQYVRATGFYASPASVATGMQQLNNRLFMIGNVTANTFVLYDPQTGLAIDSSAYTAYTSGRSAQFTLTGESLDIQSAPPVYRVTLGTTIMGADNDVIYVRASKANVYTDLGDVA